MTRRLLVFRSPVTILVAILTFGPLTYIFVSAPIAAPTAITSLVSPPPGILSDVPIYITNFQSSPTPAPFQQLITIQSSNYTSQEASNLQNVEFFYANGTIIPSWLESGNSSSASATVYWLKLAGGIKATSTVTIYMGFASLSTVLFDGVNVGEAPQLSPTYAQYDDGATVFSTLYQNFHGTGTPSGWISVGTLTINNGVSINNSQAIIGTSAMYGSDPNQVFDAVGKMLPASGIGQVGAGYIGGTGSLYSVGGTYQAGIGTTVTNNPYSGDFTGGSGGFGSGYTYVDLNVPTDSSTHIYTTYYTETSDTVWLDYSHGVSVPLRGPATTYPVGMTGDNSGSVTTGPYYVMRIRAYPPNGVMPTVSLSSHTPPAAPTGLTATLNHGVVTLQWQLPISNGGSPITGYNVYRSTTSGVHNLLTRTSNQTGATGTYNDTTGTAGNTYYYVVSALNTYGESGFSNEASVGMPNLVLSGLNLISLEAGRSGGLQVNLTSAGGFSGSVSLSVAGLPAGVSSSWTVNPVSLPMNGAASTTLTLNVGAGTSSGQYAIIVNGTSGGSLAQLSFTLNVVRSSILTLIGEGSIQLGSPINLSGTLVNSTGGPISGALLRFEYRVPSEETYSLITTATTTSTGSYAVGWIPSATGDFILQARFAGNQPYLPSRAALNISVAPFVSSYVFSVQSNATLTSLYFNSTANILSFTVSGPHPSVGHVQVYIAKSLVGNIAALTLKIDGKNATYTISDTPNAYIINFYIGLTVHYIIMGIPIRGPSQTPTLYAPFLGITLLGLAASVVRRRLGRDVPA